MTRPLLPADNLLRRSSALFEAGGCFMDQIWTPMKPTINRRSFVKTGLAAGVAKTRPRLLCDSPAFAETEANSRLTQGDAAMLRFAAAAEILETDLWEQYNELGGIQDKEEPSGSGNSAFNKKLKVLDGDMDKYVHD